MNQANTLSWVDLVVGVVAAFGFGLALYDFVMNVRERHKRLEMKVSHFQTKYTDNQVAWVLFRIVFVNPSSVGKTVAGVLHNNPPGITLKEPNHQYDPITKVVTSQLPNGKTFPLPHGESLQYPFDIPPYQSCVHWYFLVLGKIGNQPYMFPIYLKFRAENVREKKIANEPAFQLYEQDLLDGAERRL
jgi:hypothetical protein